MNEADVVTVIASRLFIFTLLACVSFIANLVLGFKVYERWAQDKRDAAESERRLAELSARAEKLPVAVFVPPVPHDYFAGQR